ncbi:hypothetical protein [Duganella radicis]|uniref:Alpha/beta hydrolase n=1 Tax=Duganella radicis TaxID=551988 RepID=A0A6L6PRL7_9BURK|nr:hypothetical protein [Duganella radicis]MTV41277.1 hypothetical protein [Duganella radicis]
MLSLPLRRTLRRASLLLPILLLPALLPACGTPYRPPLLPDTPPAVFPGLIDIAAQAGGREADVLLVHGICTHDAGWLDEVLPPLTRAVRDATATAPARVAGASAAAVQIVPATIATPAGRLRFDALIWSPLTSDLKRQLCYDQSGKSALCTGAPPYPYTRAKLNARFKDGLIDDCLPDALIYAGAARETMQLRMREAVLQVLSGMRADAPLVVISHSMGSKMLFDTLLRMSNEPAGSPAALAAQQAVRRLRFLVMAANQIPLLSLAEQAPASMAAATDAGDATPPPDSLQRLLRQHRTLAATPPLTLVAFTDPNDLLSYTLPPERYEANGVTVHNILVSNAPTYLGLLERPDTAHLNYLSNPDIGRLIACGQPTSKLCN